MECGQGRGLDSWAAATHSWATIEAASHFDFFVVGDLSFIRLARYW